MILPAPQVDSRQNHGAEWYGYPATTYRIDFCRNGGWSMVAFCPVFRTFLLVAMFEMPHALYPSSDGGPAVTGLATRSNFLYGNWAIAQMAISADDRLALGRGTNMSKRVRYE